MCLQASGIVRAIACTLGTTFAENMQHKAASIGTKSRMKEWYFRYSGAKGVSFCIFAKLHWHHAISLFVTSPNLFTQLSACAINMLFLCHRTENKIAIHCKLGLWLHVSPSSPTIVHTETHWQKKHNTVPTRYDMIKTHNIKIWTFDWGEDIIWCQKRFFQNCSDSAHENSIG